jgi:DNA processing protein
VAVRFIARGSADYPPALNDLPTPPQGMYTVGSLATLDAIVVTVVGTRDSTPYGERVTRELCTHLTRAGACVVSGMARGIDAAAHRAALAAGGLTAAVLGTGVDVPYPVGHRELHERIGKRGLLLSEFLPGQRAARGSFPRRNRILAALAKLTIVVEAGRKSGALLTAGHAVELGRTVGVIPGPIDSPQSEGSNELMRDGAHVIATIDDALMLAGLGRQRRAARLELGDTEERILRELRRGATDLDGLAARTALPARECMMAVTMLELAGAVECTLTGEIRVR